MKSLNDERGDAMRRARDINDRTKQSDFEAVNKAFARASDAAIREFKASRHTADDIAAENQALAAAENDRAAGYATADGNHHDRAAALARALSGQTGHLGNPDAPHAKTWLAEHVPAHLWLPAEVKRPTEYAQVEHHAGIKQLRPVERREDGTVVVVFEPFDRSNSRGPSSLDPKERAQMLRDAVMTPQERNAVEGSTFHAEPDPAGITQKQAQPGEARLTEMLKEKSIVIHASPGWENVRN